MRVPVFLVVAGTFAAVPPVVGAVFWRRLAGARAWAFGWAVSEATETAVQWWLSARHVPNLWLGYVFEPLNGALLLWALSLWQSRALARLTLRLAIPAVLAAFLWLALAFDGTSSFSRAAQPMLFLVCLGASAYTLVERSRLAAGDLVRSDWMWICAGAALLYGTGSVLFPLSRLLLGGDLRLFIVAYELISALAALAFLAVARGMACPTGT